mgnify:CR=1 FL=1
MKFSKSFWDVLPKEIQSIILDHRAALQIQRCAIKKFYYKYGITWKQDIKNYDDYLDYYCYRYGINDPPEDYYNYYYTGCKYDFP